MSSKLMKIIFVVLQVAALVYADDGSAAVVTDATVAEEPVIAPAVQEIYVCESGEPNFLGTFTQSKAQNDGAPVYNNANDMSFFRNKGFWYLGDLAPWPPATHYRCVEYEGCNYNGLAPPTSVEGKWAASRLGKTPVIVVSSTPCASGAGEEL